MSKQIHLLLSCLTIFCTLFTSCNRKQPSETNIDYSLPDTLVVGTLYSPTSYFLYKGDLMGYHYDLISQFAKDKNIPIKFKVMRNMGALLSLLDSAKSTSLPIMSLPRPNTKTKCAIADLKTSPPKCWYSRYIRMSLQFPMSHSLSGKKYTLKKFKI